VYVSRYWDISVDGLCTEPDDIIEIPSFPIYCCTIRKGEKYKGKNETDTDENENEKNNEEFSSGGSSSRGNRGGRGGIEFACGGGNGDASFIGTPVHLFNKP
jgi:hypothetical protein